MSGKYEHGAVAQLRERLVCIQKVAGSTPVRSTMWYKMEEDRDLEDIITEAILDLLLDAKENGLDTLSFEDVCRMLGVDDTSLMTQFEKGVSFTLNKEFLEKLNDPEVRQAMIESFKATKH